MAAHWIEDTIPKLQRCHGRRPQAACGAISVISCQQCDETITVETPPFFANLATQREHETWRAVIAWNGRKIPKSTP
ncbi:hypothetical protein [Rhizobium binae]|uniref:hypothetical protein n=1 Tax=Rhizobium binae TaxID=1138190 RepID=UPI001C83B504|nr:hypothetical protein [Rhizobium binae]MBX4944654.1 hypothetical protein [Rhizobium binae]MBX4980685.1 hypothetical protein [Rhizobium binae]